MVDRYIQGVIVFICSLLFVCGCDEHVDISETGGEDDIVTLLERKAMDSLFTNNAYSRSLLRKNMSQTADSLSYYRLMNVYSKACFAASQFDSVVYYSRIILHFCQKSSDSPQIHDLFSATYNMMGNVWGRWNFPDSAVVYYQKAYEHRKQGNELSYLPDICINLADGNVHKSDYTDAAYYYRRAYEYLRRDQELNDSIRNEQIRTRVAELDMRYSQDTIVMRRELLIEKQSGEMKVLRLTSYIWAIACVGSIAVLFFLYRLMKKKRAFLQERLLNQISRLRMENIRNHVSPHFTFNVLNREISRFKGTDRERSGLVDLVKLLRKSLEMTEKLSVPLREELDFVQTYIGLERDRLGENFILDLSVDTTLDVEKIIVPSMIVQIPVENAIKHGLAGMEGEKRLEISVMPEGNGVRIMIADNGRGYLPQVMSPTRGTGTGLKVLYQTIQLLNAKNKGEKIRFEITNLADGMRTGTGVSVYIPCNYSYDL